MEDLFFLRVVFGCGDYCCVCLFFFVGGCVVGDLFVVGVDFVFVGYCCCFCWCVDCVCFCDWFGVFFWWY